MAAGHSVDPVRRQEACEVLMGRIAGRFARVEPRRRVRDLVPGLLSDLPRKNCWGVTEWPGEAGPDDMQHLLGRARWDADAVRDAVHEYVDDVREYVLEHLRDEDAVLVVDETGDVKEGTHTVGVQRQYTGTAGRIGTRRSPSTSSMHANADALAAKVPRRASQKLAAGAGTKGHRFYDSAVIDLAEPRPGSHQLLIRRNRTTRELAYYRCFSPTPVPPATLVRVTGSRWQLEESWVRSRQTGSRTRARQPIVGDMVSLPSTEPTVFHAALREQFETFLDEHRSALHDSLNGLTDEQARLSLVTSKTTLLGLVKHATFVEKVWFDEAVTCRSRAEIGIPETPDESFDLDDNDTIASVQRAHQRACAASRRATAELTLDDLVLGNRRGPLPLRWVYLHVLRELAQHCGHADILREQVLGGKRDG
ncbi:DUF664 domain-containing protein [Streptomyces kurssanovii]|uniref:DUF664 domain-containing protein n=1 Tax=Streptomyces kurssanovii TaxID=67312 RepID=A0ABV3HR91_9ACTN